MSYLILIQLQCLNGARETKPKRLFFSMFLFLGLGDGWGMKPALTRRPEILKELGSHLLQTLDGFIFVLSADGKIM